MPANYKARYWFWKVGNDENQVYDSEQNKIIPINDRNYRDWVNHNNTPSRIRDYGELLEVLIIQAPEKAKGAAKLFADNHLITAEQKAVADALP